MTAPEPTPTAEHRDAIARLVWATSRADESTISAIGAQAVTHAILTSTDPAVHAAMLAALVRAGVLTEEQHCAYARAAQADGDYRSYTCEDAGTHCPPPRLVTRWEVATVHRQMPNSLAPTECPCVSCLTEAGVSAWWMIVCDECGNKRCPHGTDHRHECSGSNEPGQAGSRYAATTRGIPDDPRRGTPSPARGGDGGRPMTADIGPVVKAVEQAMCRLIHGEDWTVPAALPDSPDPAEFPFLHAVEVARAAEAAALGAIAGDWLIERTYGLSDEGIKGWPEINANAYRCAIEDAQSALRERADELTDETGEQ